MRILRTAKEPAPLSSGGGGDPVELVQTLCAANNVVLLYLHGSHARGEQGPLSDMDLAVLLKREGSTSLDSELDFLAALQSASGREDGGLVFLHRAGPPL